MKNFKHYIFITISFIILPALSNALYVKEYHPTAKPFILATKGNKKIKYKIGKCLSIFYGSNSKKNKWNAH